MSNGYLIAAEADLAAAHEIGEGFGLDVIDAFSIGDHAAAASALASAANVGLVISSAAVRDPAFVALLRSLSLRLQTAQLIFVDAEARAELAFLPHQWPSMTMEDAKARAVRRLQANRPADADAPRAHPITPPEPAPEAPQERAQAATPEPEIAATPEPEVEPPPFDEEPAPESDLEAPVDEGAQEGVAEDALASETVEASPDAAATPVEDEEASFGHADAAAPENADADNAEQAAPPLAMPAPAPPQAPPTARAKRSEAPAAAPSAPADATAFAPKKLRRGTPELVRIVVHQPKQLNDVIKAARKVDARAEPAPQGMSIGDVALGAEVGVSLDVRGASCDGALQRRIWAGEPIDFNFSVEAEDDVKQAVFLARVFIGEAQIGVLAFTRGVSGPAKKAASPSDARLKRHKRVFLSYSSADRETVSVIATAYEMAGVEHFWDRTSLKSGEEWTPRLRREIDRADLFHLCWSKAAAQSEWVEKEAEHALTRRKKSNGKRPDITVQMLDGPPWAAHPPHLDSINFDDFVRAAIVGYARGDGES
jgi:hypothetical protein